MPARIPVVTWIGMNDLRDFTTAGLQASCDVLGQIRESGGRHELGGIVHSSGRFLIADCRRYRRRIYPAEALCVRVQQQAADERQE